ncbi:MAG TPA: LysM peptidoglycan-binding domain-containing protein [Steroidobacteraceae bacterium]
MKTATQQIRPAMVLCLIAGLTVTAAMAPITSIGQETTRTIATGSKIPLTADAPDQYVVKKGDTLWDISKVYLRDPWYWPEIWYVNPQVQNPHLIYPGDVLKLVYVDGQPRLTIAERGAERSGDGKRLSPEVRREPLSRAITAIPYDVIAGFAGRPTLLDLDQVKTAPYVIGMRDRHMIAASGNEIYAHGIEGATADSRYNIIHVERKLYDPETRDLLGYTGIYVGSGPVIATGDPAKLVLTDSSREALQGDKVFPETVEVGTDFVPHVPASDVDATVIAAGTAKYIGQYQIVALNRGTQNGLEPGHVLAIEQHGDVVRDKYSRGGLGAEGVGVISGGRKVQMPAERVGTVMVFRAFPRMSYALVMESTHEILEGDRAKNP